MYYLSAIATALATTSQVIAQAGKIIEVQVGANGLTFTPNEVTAKVGTAIEFSFFPKNHSVTQSSFSDPCHPLSQGFFSGFVPISSAGELTATFTVTVSDKKPIWIYCGQRNGNHCQSGMVAAINAPKSGSTFDAFRKLARNATLSSSPAGGPKGGALKWNDTSSTSLVGSTTSSTLLIQTFITTSMKDDSTTYTTTYAKGTPTTYTSATTWVSISPVATNTTATASSPSVSIVASNAAEKVEAKFLRVIAILGAVFAFF